MNGGASRQMNLWTIGAGSSQEATEFGCQLQLNLGLTESTTRKTLGQPTDARDGTLFYCHEHEETIDKVTYTISNDLVLRFRDNVLWAILVSKISSN